MVRTDIGNSGRYPEADALRPPAGTPPNLFAVHVAERMRSAEPASAFAERVLQGLEADAPFYWLTHPETRTWIDGRHRTIEQARPPLQLQAPA